MPTTPKPHAYTKDEVRNQFLDYLWNILDYWETLPGKTKREAMSGFMHSTLVALDGGAMSLPGFTVKPNPHPSDKAYHKAEGSNWYPANVDIGGSLHELMHRRDPKRLRPGETEGRIPS